MAHKPVLVEEMLVALNPKDGEVYIDATYGGGGYAERILDTVDCQVVAIDRDRDAIKRAAQHARRSSRLIPVHGRFGHLDALVHLAGIERADGVIFDFGLSSFQIDEADRGFSFMRDGPLDMRMSQHGPTAEEVLAQIAPNDLLQVIKLLGEENNARKIVKAIIDRRENNPFKSTRDLAETIEKSVGGRKGAPIHPATRTFQAIRMLVNDELREIAKGLTAAERILENGGRLIAITFHSIEDRIVKLFFRNRAGIENSVSRHQPVTEIKRAPSFQMIMKKAIKPSSIEVASNPRSRSAKLRSATRTIESCWEDPIEPNFEIPCITQFELESS